MKTSGIVLFIIGLLLTIFTTFKFFTKEKIVDIGKVEITADKGHKVSWSPMIGVAMMVIGGVVFYTSSRK